MGYLLMISAVVVHHPDFFVAAAVADKINLALTNAGYTAAQAENDFIGKLVSDETRRLLGAVVGILFSEHLRSASILYVKEPALHSDFAAHYPKVAECQHGGVGRGRIPGRKSDVRRLSRHLQWIETLGDHLDHSGIVQIVPQRVVESLQQGRVLRVAGGRLEVGNGESHLFGAQRGAGANPVLGIGGSNGEAKQESDQNRQCVGTPPERRPKN